MTSNKFTREAKKLAKEQDIPLSRAKRVIEQEIGSHTISWNLGVDENGNQVTRQIDEQVPVDYIYGEPGNWKTTFLHSIIHQIASQDKSHSLKLKLIDFESARSDSLPAHPGLESFGPERESTREGIASVIEEIDARKSNPDLRSNKLVVFFDEPFITSLTGIIVQEERAIIDEVLGSDEKLGIHFILASRMRPDRSPALGSRLGWYGIDNVTINLSSYVLEGRKMMKGVAIVNGKETRFYQDGSSLKKNPEFDPDDISAGSYDEGERKWSPGVNHFGESTFIPHSGDHIAVSGDEESRRSFLRSLIIQYGGHLGQAWITSREHETILGGGKRQARDIFVMPSGEDPIIGYQRLTQMTSKSRASEPTILVIDNICEIGADNSFPNRQLLREIEELVAFTGRMNNISIIYGWDENAEKDIPEDCKKILHRIKTFSVNVNTVTRDDRMTMCDVSDIPESPDTPVIMRDSSSLISSSWD